MAVPAPGLGGMAWAALLVAEYLVLTVLVDFAAVGAGRVVAAARMLSPALVGAGAAGLLLARHAARPEPQSVVAAAPGPRPWALLGLQVVAFLATAASGHRLMGPGAPPAPASAFAAWAACAGLAAALALGLLAPPRALLRAAVRHARVPLLAVAVGLLAWRAVAAAEGTWGALRGGTLAAVAGVLRLAGRDVLVLAEESVVGAGAFSVEIAPECSGVDGVGLVVLFQAVWLSLRRGGLRFGRALLVLVPLGAVAALAANVLRLSTLVLVGASGAEDLALGAFHSKLGWLLFIGVALGTVAAAERVPWLRRPVQNATARDVGFPTETAAYVAPLLAALATALLTSLWSGGAGFDRWYGARLVAGIGVLVAARRSLPRPALSFSWAPLALAAAVCAFWIPWGGARVPALEAALAALGSSERAAWIAVRLAGACLVLPILEELAFRGFLLPWLIAPNLERLPPRTWSWPAVLLSSLAFGALHEHVLLGTAAGVAFAAARLWRGRLGDAIVAHVLCNISVAIAVLAGGRWDLWG